MSQQQRRCVHVVGARPQYLQVPLLRRELQAAGVSHHWVHTGQHYDRALADDLIDELELGTPFANLGVGSGRHGAMTGRTMERLEDCLIGMRPDFVIADGDTNSTLATALVATKLHIPFVHLESGLRDWDRRRPEELNRVLADHAADVCLAPIPRALANLSREGLSDRSALVGDFLLDAFVEFRQRSMAAADVPDPGVQPPFNILTLHRPENTDVHECERFDQVLSFVNSLDVPAIYPVHPRVRPALNELHARGQRYPQVQFIEPVTYLQMLRLLGQAEAVFTDSGGLSREAVWSGAKCMMFFDFDSWHDMLDLGWAVNAPRHGAPLDEIYRGLRRPPGNEAIEYFGGGRASANAVAELRKRGLVDAV
ncbi:MAG TPA: UDP-N-acetylglucosamine 2-epimerase (non-hydrolyzing) [Actinobacteria bacterium]|nr:UDP-N-acetylglucosamine 2-epimerase (non-hydrolyzing) [Actinomycetota bacterium]